MLYSKYLNVLLKENCVKNFTETGEVISSFCTDFNVVEFLSKALGFHYKVYSTRFYNRSKPDLLIGNTVLNEHSYPYATYPYLALDATFATEKPIYASQILSFLKPFTLNVWIGLLTSIILAALTYFLVFRRTPFSSVLFRILATFVGMHHNWRPRTLAQRILVLTWSMGVMFLALSYVSVLLSSLTVPVRVKGITDFNELYEAIYDGKAKARVFKNSDIGDSFVKWGNERLKFLGEHVLKQNKINKSNFQTAIKPNVAVLGMRSVLEAAYGGQRHFISQDSIFTTFATMIDFTDDGLFRADQVNSVFHRIWSSGLVQKIQNDDKFNTTLRSMFRSRNFYSLEQDPVSPLTLSSMSGAFIILITGYVLGLVSLICEIFIHRYSPQN